jgi:extracellular elastinolytic metalloproteinase
MKYTSDLSQNPATYSYIGKSDYATVHAKGFVWATMLLEVYWNLVGKAGFHSNWYESNAMKGNTVFLQLMIDGLKLQPCRPTFLDARNAILLADEARYQGSHHCDIWNGFSKRGLGYSAQPVVNSTYTDAFDLPLECS